MPSSPPPERLALLMVSLFVASALLSGWLVLDLRRAPVARAMIRPLLRAPATVADAFLVSGMALGIVLALGLMWATRPVPIVVRLGVMGLILVIRIVLSIAGRRILRPPSRPVPHPYRTAALVAPTTRSTERHIGNTASTGARPFRLGVLLVGVAAIGVECHRQCGTISGLGIAIAMTTLGLHLIAIGAKSMDADETSAHG